MQDGTYVCTIPENLQQAREEATRSGIDPSSVLPGDLETTLDPDKMAELQNMNEEQRDRMTMMLLRDSAAAHRQLHELKKRNEELQREREAHELKKLERRVQAVAPTVEHSVDMLPDEVFGEGQDRNEVKRAMARVLVAPGNEHLAASQEALALKNRQLEEELARARQTVRQREEQFKALAEKRRSESEQVSAIFDSGLVPGIKYSPPPELMAHSAKRQRRQEPSTTGDGGMFTVDSVFEKYFSSVRSSQSPRASSSSSFASSSSSSSTSAASSSSTPWNAGRGYDDRGDSGARYEHSRRGSSSSSSSSSDSGRDERGRPTLDALVEEHEQQQAARAIRGGQLYRHNRQSNSRKRAYLETVADEKTGFNVFEGSFDYLTGREREEDEARALNTFDGKGKAKAGGKRGDAPQTFRHSRVASMNHDIKEAEESDLQSKALQHPQAVMKDVMMGREHEYGLRQGAFRKSLAYYNPKLFNAILAEDIFQNEVPSNGKEGIHGFEKFGDRSVSLHNSAIPKGFAKMSQDQILRYNARVLNKFNYDQEDRKHIELSTGLRQSGSAE